MNDFREGELFILLVIKYGVKKYGKNSGDFRSEGNTEVLAGSLLRLVEKISSHKKAEYELETIDDNADRDSSVRIFCSPGDEIRSVALSDFQLLRPIPTCKERLEVFNDENWLNDGRRIQEADHVFVKLKRDLSEIGGIVRLKKDVLDSKGILFGIELEEPRGTSDGKYRGVQFFKAKADHAVFVALHKVRRFKDGWQMKSRMRADYDGANFPPPRTKMVDKPQLDIGERIVWMSDYGPEGGVVKWIGCLPGDVSSNITVGVEFDKKVGSGTGKYKDKRLFFAKQGHASLVPPMGLLKESEFSSPAGIPYHDCDDNPYVDVAQPTGNVDALDSDFSGNRQTKSHKAALYSDKVLMGTGMPLPGAAAMSNLGAGKVPSGAGKMLHGKVEPGSGLGQGYIEPATSAALLQQDMMVARSAEQMAKLAMYNNAGGSGGASAGGSGGVRTVTSGINPIYDHFEQNRRLHEQSSEGGAAGARQPQSTGSGASAVVPGQVAVKPDPDLDVGSLVQVQLKVPLYGIIRWIGVTQAQPDKMTAGLEMDEELSAGTDGIYRGTRYFTCPPKKGLFVPLHRCTKDQRYNFFTSTSSQSNDFGDQQTPDLEGDIAPPEALTQGELNAICGKYRGIQGHHNSCYLDATLFCMFYFSTVFDAIFNRPANSEDLPEYSKVQRVLKEGIVNPLRKHKYVRADKVLKLRELLDKLGTVPGMMGEEKDPEEFLNALLTQIMKADPILQLSSGQHAYFYQLFIEEDEKLLLPTTQKLVELSFLQGNVKLKEVPPCLMIQMPRFGKDYKMFHRIVPSLELDITHIVENCPRDCIVCGGLATYECKDCYQVHGPGLNTTAFCKVCVEKSHRHHSRRGHQPQAITSAEDFLSYYDADNADNISLPRETMELFAVICIQTSHYVSFVKCGIGPDAPWVFFDSMADRMGEQGGYNIPEVVHVPRFAEWLDKKSLQDLHKSNDDRDLPEHLRRVLCDGYMCMYQSTSVMMYQ